MRSAGRRGLGGQWPPLIVVVRKLLPLLLPLLPMLRRAGGADEASRLDGAWAPWHTCLLVGGVGKMRGHGCCATSAVPLG